MPTPPKLEDNSWSALEFDGTTMLLDAVEGGHALPMIAQIEGDKGPICFFAAGGNAIVQKLKSDDRPIATFVSKGHDPSLELRG